jgi:hypothetical protein
MAGAQFAQANGLEWCAWAALRITPSRASVKPPRSSLADALFAGITASQAVGTKVNALVLPVQP